MDDKEIKRYAKQMQAIFDRSSLPPAHLAGEIVDTWTPDQLVMLVATVWSALIYRMIKPADNTEIDYGLRAVGTAIIRNTTLGRDLAKAFSVKV